MLDGNCYFERGVQFRNFDCLLYWYSVLYVKEKVPSIFPFLTNNGDEAPKGPNPIIFQEWTDTRTPQPKYKIF